MNTQSKELNTQHQKGFIRWPFVHFHRTRLPVMLLTCSKRCATDEIIYKTSTTDRHKTTCILNMKHFSKKKIAWRSDPS